jgi:hypothetical protein
MLRIIRDTAALFELEKQLQTVREMQLRAVRDGRPMAAAELQEAEERVIDQVKRDYFCAAARLVYLPPAEAEALTDRQDYQGRQNIDAENCMFEAHHHLLALACVGATDHDDPDSGPLTTAGGS